MKITATFGLALLTNQPLPKNLPPIMADLGAIEEALTAIVRASNAHAVSMGREPEIDLAVGELRSDHGIIAALIADPVSEAFNLAGSILAQRIRNLTTDEECAAISRRIRALADPKARYAADTRPRH